tara:strand:- start:11205 stop:11873 length:669 start_codon:yes stop_codon:yes gene_type:complete
MLNLLFCVAMAGVPQKDIHHHLKESIDERRSYFSNREGELVEIINNARASFRLRYKAYSTLVQLQPSKKNLLMGLASHEWFMRDLGIKLAAKYRPKLAKIYAEKYLTDPSLVVRTSAVKILKELQVKESTESLWEALHSKQNFRGQQSLWVRKHIVSALASLHSGDRHMWAKRFRSILDDRDASLHAHALYALAGLYPNGPKTNRTEPVEIQRKKWLAFLSK